MAWSTVKVLLNNKMVLKCSGSKLGKPDSTEVRTGSSCPKVPVHRKNLPNDESKLLMYNKSK